MELLKPVTFIWIMPPLRSFYSCGYGNNRLLLAGKAAGSKVMRILGNT